MIPRDLKNAAFSLVEVTLALGIAAFCLIAVFGLMPIGVQTNRNATSQTAANNIIAAIVADLRATPKTSTDLFTVWYPIWAGKRPLLRQHRRFHSRYTRCEFALPSEHNVPI